MKQGKGVSRVRPASVKGASRPSLRPWRPPVGRQRVSPVVPKLRLPVLTEGDRARQDKVVSRRVTVLCRGGRRGSARVIVEGARLDLERKLGRRGLTGRNGRKRETGRDLMETAVWRVCPWVTMMSMKRGALRVKSPIPLTRSRSRGAGMRFVVAGAMGRMGAGLQAGLVAELTGILLGQETYSLLRYRTLLKEATKQRTFGDSSQSRSGKRPRPRGRGFGPVGLTKFPGPVTPAGAGSVKPSPLPAPSTPPRGVGGYAGGGHRVGGPGPVGPRRPPVRRG